MSVRDRLAGRLPWTQIDGTVKRQLQALKAMSGQLDTLERAQRSSTARLTELEERLSRRDSAFLGLARRQSVRLAPPEFYALASEVREDERTLLGADRLYVLWQAARNTAPLGLPSLEVGTFRGGSARFLAAALRHFAGEEREFHAVDTFEGHDASDISPYERAHEPGRFGEASFDDVRDYLTGFPQLCVHRARFPDAADAYLPEQVGLAHLDVDLYTPTAAALALLAERMPPGGIIVVDDFGGFKTPGILKAVEEFLASGRPFQSWDVDTEQALLVRR